MTRRITYANQFAISLEALSDAQSAMVQMGSLTSAVLGASRLLYGFNATPTSPASLTVNVGQGTLFSYENIDNTAFGELPTQIAADTSNQITKLASSLGQKPFVFVAPATTGFSRNDLIQIDFLEVDDNSQTIGFFNGINPATGLPNPALFQTKNTLRSDLAVISVISGVPAATGTQTTPSPTGTATAAWVVTIANGQTTLGSPNINKYPNAPFITESLTQKISKATADQLYNVRKFTASGSVIVPAGVTTMYYSGCGGGGGGGSAAGVPNTTNISIAAGGGGGGGSGDPALSRTATVIPLETITIIIGSGGSGGATSSAGGNGTPGSDGGDTTITGSFGTITLLGGDRGDGPTAPTPDTGLGVGAPGGENGGFDGETGFFTNANLTAGTISGGGGNGGCGPFGTGGAGGRLVGVDPTGSLGFPGKLGVGYGAGGGGGGGGTQHANQGSKPGAAGGDGLPGIVFINF